MVLVPKRPPENAFPLCRIVRFIYRIIVLYFEQISTIDGSFLIKKAGSSTISGKDAAFHRNEKTACEKPSQAVFFSFVGCAPLKGFFDFVARAL